MFGALPFAFGYLADGGTEVVTSAPPPSPPPGAASITGLHLFGQPYFADPGVTVTTPTPATSHRVRDTFDHWLNGVPVIVPEFDGSFSQWLNGAPDVEQGAQSQFVFTGSGIAQASALLGALIHSFVSGTGITQASAEIGHLEAHPASGTGISQANATLGHLEAHPASGTGIALASARLSTSIAAQASGSGIALASARLSAALTASASGVGIALGTGVLGVAAPTMRARGSGVSQASALLSAFISPIIGPPLPGFPSIQQSIPQYVTMFGYTMQPVLDVLKLRRVPLRYVSPPVCPGTAKQSGSSYQMTPAYL